MIVSKAEVDAKKNVEEGSLTTFDTPELMCSATFSGWCLDDIGCNKSIKFTPEPRKVGCPFWYYFESKLKHAEKKEKRSVWSQW